MHDLSRLRSWRIAWSVCIYVAKKVGFHRLPRWWKPPMLLSLEIGMFIVGLLAVFRGRLKFTAKQEVYGGAARLAGLILMAPVPVAFISGFAIGFHAAVDGRALDLKAN